MSTKWHRVGLFYECDEQLRISNASAPSEQPPADWPSLNDGQAQEEVLETLMILNLATILGEPVRFLFRAGDYWGLQDITGVDPLGRIHLFELKRDDVGPDVPRQLATYLLGTLFNGARDYAQWTWQLNADRLDALRWEIYLAAALANERTSNIGRKYINKHRGDSGEKLSKSDWKSLNEVASGSRDDARGGDLLVEALVANAAKRGVTVPSRSELNNWAAEVRESTCGPKPEPPQLWVQPQGVIWLVGRSFDDGALEQIRGWRGAGVDARWLMVDARQSQQTGRWLLRVHREDFPERTLLLSKLHRDVAESQGRNRVLEIKLYSTTAASKKDQAGGGEPLGDRASARLSELHGEREIKTWRP